MMHRTELRPLALLRGTARRWQRGDGWVCHSSAPTPSPPPEELTTRPGSVQVEELRPRAAAEVALSSGTA